MTTNEIKTLIQNTIAGQGSQVDIGGKLADVLNALADAVSGAGKTVLFTVNHATEEYTDEASVLQGITIDGRPATKDDFLGIDYANTRVVVAYPDGGVHLVLCAVNRYDNNILLVFGGQYPEYAGWQLFIALDGDENSTSRYREV